MITCIALLKFSCLTFVLEYYYSFSPGLHSCMNALVAPLGLQIIGILR